jgi:hypothetical protein
MTRENVRIASSAILLAVCMVFAGCNQDPEPEFTASEFTISAENTVNELNITPAFALSSDEAVAVAEIIAGGLTITSKKNGTAFVSVSDFSSVSNAASIDVTVDATGKITAQISKFNGNLVVAIIKEPVSVAGIVGSEITSKDVKLMLDNNNFTGIKVNDNVSSWVSNLPRGLAAKISDAGSGAYIHEITFVISGTPQAAYTGILAITIPAEHTVMGTAVNVSRNVGAKFDIGP